MTRVYIAGIASITPKTYCPNHVINTFYPDSTTTKQCRNIANKLVKRVGIESRPTVIDLNKFPEIRLLSEKYSALNWGINIVDQLTTNLNKKHIGHLSVSYNISAHDDFIPNLACQIAIDRKLDLDSPAEELFGYGCASGMLSMKSAIEYCQKFQKGALVFMYEHSLTLANPIYDTSNPDFKANLRSHLLFSDGAIGLLILPESLVEKSKKGMLEILDLDTNFKLGNAIQMKKGKFLVGDNVKDIMPKMVSKHSIIPTLERNALTKSDIDEWSIHQGGIPVLEKFTEPKILGLSEDQIDRSRMLFKRFGNFSTPSCFFVLDSYFRQPDRQGTYGAVVSFGAGYYFGTALYKRH